MQQGKSISQLRTACQPILDNDEVSFPVLFQGRHGLGKSEFVHQLAKELGLEVVEVRASQLMPGDLLGMPQKHEEYTKWKPPFWLYLACNRAVVLFLDEIDRASTQVRQGIFQLTGSRRLHDNHLHPETQIFGAVNTSEGETEYMTGEFDPAELDRWVAHGFDPTHEEWLEWAAENGVNRYVQEYIANNKKELDLPEELSGNKVMVSRRSWDRASQVLNAEYGPSTKPNPEEAYLIVSGFVGSAAANGFADFLREYESTISINDVAENLEMYREDLEGNDEAHRKILRQFTAEYGDKENEDLMDLSEEKRRNLAKFMAIPSPEVSICMFKKTPKGSDFRKEIGDVSVDEKYFQDSGSLDKDPDELTLMDYISHCFDADERIEDRIDDLNESVKRKIEELEEEAAEGEEPDSEEEDEAEVEAEEEDT